MMMAFGVTEALENYFRRLASCSWLVAPSWNLVRTLLSWSRALLTLVRRMGAVEPWIRTLTLVEALCVMQSWFVVTVLTIVLVESVLVWMIARGEVTPLLWRKLAEVMVNPWPLFMSRARYNLMVCLPVGSYVSP